MKRLNSSDSLGAFMSICPSTDEHSPRTTNHYSREFQSMLDGLDDDVCTEEGGHVVEKKRRLSVDQVKALEKNFEVENKLEPERKVKLAQELGLQPRQVAVWFQNRRARWKTKQLERDYGVLKANYESLKLNFESLQHENGNLLKEIKELKTKLNEENTESNMSIKEEIILPDCDDTPLIETVTAQELKDINANNSNNNNGVVEVANFFQDLKDGSSDSDSSAILNEDNSPNHGQLIMSTPPSSSSMNCFQFVSSKTYSETQLVKMEEHNFFSSEETCNFFSDEQPPSLQWYCPDQWN